MGLWILFWDRITTWLERAQMVVFAWGQAMAEGLDGLFAKGKWDSVGMVDGGGWKDWQRR